MECPDCHGKSSRWACDTCHGCGRVVTKIDVDNIARRSKRGDSSRADEDIKDLLGYIEKADIHYWTAYQTPPE